MHSAHTATLLVGFCLLTGGICIANANADADSWVDWEEFYRLGLDREYLWECPVWHYRALDKDIQDKAGPCVSYEVTQKGACIEPNKYENMQRSFYLGDHVVCDLYKRKGCPSGEPEIRDWAGDCTDTLRCRNWEANDLEGGPKSMFCAQRPLGWFGKGAHTRAPT